MIYLTADAHSIFLNPMIFYLNIFYMSMKRPTEKTLTIAYHSESLKRFAVLSKGRALKNGRKNGKDNI